uniref:Uncharacterized protein n=1 Tax=Glossina brevipalpis TaxID=37001 RepID=A0A1A9W5H1_9MUSC
MKSIPIRFVNENFGFTDSSYRNKTSPDLRLDHYKLLSINIMEKRALMRIRRIDIIIHNDQIKCENIYNFKAFIPAIEE